METGRIRRRFDAYMDLSRDIDRQIDRLTRLEASALSPSAPSLDGMPTGKGMPGDRVGRSVALMDELQEDVSRMIATEKTERAALEQMMAVLAADEKAVLRVLFFDRTRLEDAAEMLDLSVSSIKNYKKRAFERLEGMYGSAND